MADGATVTEMIKSMRKVFTVIISFFFLKKVVRRPLGTAPTHRKSREAP